jgi:probable rRNA maturation factor
MRGNSELSGEGNVIIFDKAVRGLTKTGLSRFVARTQRVVKLKGEINVLVTTNREMRRLNRQFRKKDHATDVLSFPAKNGGLAGEIAISAETAAKNARRLGHSTADEIEILALHGLLHLAGYDHETDYGEMARKEQSLQRSLRLPSVLTSRESAKSLGSRPRTETARSERA